MSNKGYGHMGKVSKRASFLLLAILVCVMALPLRPALAQTYTEINSLTGITGSGYYKLVANDTRTTAFVIAAEWNVTLDFNGHIVTGNLDSRPITNNGTLTLLDSVGTGGIVGEDGVAYGAVANYGTLVINGGNYSFDGTMNGSTIRNNVGATLTINGGTFTGRRALANYATATINGGTFTQIGDELNYTIHNESGSLTINNATVNGKNGGISFTGGQLLINNVNASAETYYALYIENVYGPVTGTIAGGTFTSANQVAVLCELGLANDPNDIHGSKLEIKGGSFSGAQGAAMLLIYATVPGNHLVVTGGAFPGTDVTAFLPEGYEQNADGTVKAPWTPALPSFSSPFSAAAYTVSFVDGWGGTTTLRAASGALIARPASPVHEGYIFTGWYRDEACTIFWDFESDRVSGNITLYAGWIEEVVDTPKTGDALNVFGFAMLALCAAAAVNRKLKMEGRK